LTRDLEKALELEPDHLSIYGLTVEPRTALSRWIVRGAVIPTTDRAYAREFLLAHQMLTDAGYDHYEVSNYARKGRLSKHNRAYWDGSRYEGLGPSAHGFSGQRRRWNVVPWAQYERLIVGTGDATGGSEVLSAEQLALERVYLGLRVSDGLHVGEVSRLAPAIVAKAEEQGWAEEVSGRWRLTTAGWLRLDEIATALTTSLEGG
jgi:oxygen-independent coproporphyrinogen-3 oxidase